MTHLALIAALGEHTRAIGRDGALLWHIPDDLKHFKALTSGHAVIMGRKTWESLPPRFRPLPNRVNIIVTGNQDFTAKGAIVTHSVEEAFKAGEMQSSSDTVFVIGGGILYREALPYADTLYLTLIEGNEEGDVYFPPYEDRFSLQSTTAGEGTPAHRFTVWKRKKI